MILFVDIISHGKSTAAFSDTQFSWPPQFAAHMRECVRKVEAREVRD